MTLPKLYSYWRSTTAYRVRIALNIKQVRYEIQPVSLVEGAQHDPDYVKLNPGHGVPTLVLPDGTVLTQSLAIIDYLDHAYPEFPLLPDGPKARAKALAIAHQIAMDIHPLNNLKTVQHLGKEFGADAEQKADWMRHWMTLGFNAVESMLDGQTDFAVADAPMLPDICIVAQLYNAERWGLDMSPYPKIRRIAALCSALDDFRDAHPDQQPDAT